MSHSKVGQAKERIRAYGEEVNGMLQVNQDSVRQYGSDRDALRGKESEIPVVLDPRVKARLNIDDQSKGQRWTITDTCIVQS